MLTDADPKAIQQIEFVWELKNASKKTVDGETMFVLTILDKTKETRLKFSQGSVIVLQKIANYQEARVKLTNTQLNKLKYAATSMTRTKKNFQDKEWFHKLFLTTSQKIKIRNALSDNMSTNIKCSKVQMSKTI